MRKTHSDMRQKGWLLRGAHLFGLYATASATAIPPRELFARQGTCPADFSSCPGFPSNFCCPTNQACVSLAGATTLLCCPSGSDCARIKPISCDIQLQNATKNFEAVVKTTALTSEMLKCGDRCCPFGYSCNKDDCVKDKEQKAPPGASTTATPSPKPSSTTLPNQGSISSLATTSSSEPTETANPAVGGPGTVDNSQTGGGPSAAVIGGVVAGAIAAIILAVVVACLLIKRKKKKAAATPSLKLTRSSSSFGNIISNPIIVEGTAMRTDFNRRATRSFDGSTLDGGALNRKSLSSAGSDVPARNLTGNGLLRHSSIAYGYSAADLPNPPPPRTPRQGDREPSSVSINVFADPLTLTPESATNAARVKRTSNMTTFTQLMDEADLGGVARGQAYVPYRPPTSGNDSPARK